MKINCESRPPEIQDGECRPFTFLMFIPFTFLNVHIMIDFFEATINGNFNGGVYFNTTEHILNDHLCIYFYSETNGNKKFSV